MTAYPLTLLKSYSSLKTVIHEIDKLIYETAISPYPLGYEQSTFSHVETITKYVQKRDNLEILKRAIAKVLNGIDHDTRVLLYLRFIKRAKISRIADFLGCSLRTVYRKSQRALITFSKALTRSGYNETWFLENYSKIRWLSALYKRIQSCSK